MTLKQRLEEVTRQGSALLLDGAMGTMIMRRNLTEEDFRGAEFRDWPVQLKGNNDLLVLTRPDVIADIHRQYLEAGADIICTCSFSSQRISQQEYQLTDHCEQLCRESVRLARTEADRMTALTPAQPRFVLGDIGPTSRMLSMSEDVNDPAARSITFDELEAAFLNQMRWLMEEGVDGILVETIFDTLNAKAAISAYQRLMEERRKATVPCDSVAGFTQGDVPLLLSMTVSDASGRTLSGQTIPAFCLSVAHSGALSVGMNCGLGPADMLPYLRQMRAATASPYVTCHPNAGLPNQLGDYDVTPEDMVAQMRPMLDEGLVSIIGGCCGTTPEHIRAMRQLIDAQPATVPSDASSSSSNRELSRTFENFRELSTSSSLSLSGLEPFSFPPSSFILVGERCNVAGSRKFLRLINERHYDEALDIARRQVEQGAQVIDINMDDGLLDARQEMRTFLNLLASDPSICRVPVMIDSSRFEVIEEGLKCFQGKAIVNSISLKQGEEEFLRQAHVVRRLGAAVIVMCFDEEGQATDYDRRIHICQCAYRLLTEQAGFPPTDIIFDPNILTIATGMAEHANYALDFLRATEWITRNLPGTRVSGGLSNLSFAFRGNNPLREAMHSVFLHLARQRGMGMAIMNPATAVRYEEIDCELRDALEAVILNTTPPQPSPAGEGALELLLKIAERMKAEQEAKKQAQETSKQGQETSKQLTQEATVPCDSFAGSSTPSTPPSPSSRLRQALLTGTETTLATDLQALLAEGQTPLQIISGPLMQGMNEVGRLFGEGKMFLPQVVKTARTMKHAVDILLPPAPHPTSPEGEAYIPTPQCPPGKATLTTPSPRGGQGVGAAGRVLLATVKGDVHDIGKNIVGVVLACNGFEVIDLGVMVPCETIIREAIERQVDIVCLSGLITPSLEEMCHVAEAMQQAGLQIPLFVGGATTSAVHTALKLAPLYDGGVYHLRDAAQDPVLAMQLLDPAQRDKVKAENLRQQQRIRLSKATLTPALSLSEGEGAFKSPSPSPLAQPATVPCDSFAGLVSQPSQRQQIAMKQLLPLIDWPHFFWAWRVKADTPEGQLLRQDAEGLLQELAADSANDLLALTAFYPAKGTGTAIEVTLADRFHGVTCPCCGGVPHTVSIETPRQHPTDRHGKPRATRLALCDFVSPEADYVGCFAATVSPAFQQRIEALKQSRDDDYLMLLLQTLGDRLVEAASEHLSRTIYNRYGWGGIRPAIGYPSLPDQRTIFQLARLIDFHSIGISLTENGAMYPQSSVCGLYIHHPKATYFSL